MQRTRIVYNSRKVDFFKDKEGVLNGPYLRRTPEYVEKGFYKNGEFDGRVQIHYKKNCKTEILLWRRGKLLTKETYINGKLQSVTSLIPSLL